MTSAGFFGAQPTPVHQQAGSQLVQALLAAAAGQQQAGPYPGNLLQQGNIDPNLLLMLLGLEQQPSPMAGGMPGGVPQ